MLESSLQSENITYRPHAARGCVKLQSKHIRNTYDRYTTIIIIYENCTVRLASVGLAQARPNYSQAATEAKMFITFYKTREKKKEVLYTFPDPSPNPNSIYP